MDPFAVSLSWTQNARSDMNTLCYYHSVTDRTSFTAALEDGLREYAARQYAVNNPPQFGQTESLGFNWQEPLDFHRAQLRTRAMSITASFKSARYVRLHSMTMQLLNITALT